MQTRTKVTFQLQGGATQTDQVTMKHRHVIPSLKQAEIYSPPLGSLKWKQRIPTSHIPIFNPVNKKKTKKKKHDNQLSTVKIIFVSAALAEFLIHTLHIKAWVMVIMCNMAHYWGGLGRRRS